MQYRKQLGDVNVWRELSCDLLEKSYFCSIANNNLNSRMTAKAVVICLKNRTFAVSQTTKGYAPNIARCCDLLEKSYFCSIANNLVFVLITFISVVICLKNRTFAVSQTTERVNGLIVTAL